MKFILLLVFITNLFFGQIIPGKIFLKEEDLSKISANDISDVLDKLRFQVLFITFFYSKISVSDDMDDLYNLEDTDTYNDAVYAFNILFPGGFYENSFKKIEAYLLLADIFNFADDTISLLKIDCDLTSLFDKVLLSYYKIFMVAKHQLSIPAGINEEVYNRYVNMSLNSDETFYISVDFFNKTVDLFDFILDEIIVKHLSIFLLFRNLESKLELVDQVFSNKELFSYIDLTAFRRDFFTICNLRRDRFVYEDIMADILLNHN